MKQKILSSIRISQTTEEQNFIVLIRRESLFYNFDWWIWSIYQAINVFDMRLIIFYKDLIV